MFGPLQGDINSQYTEEQITKGREKFQVLDANGDEVITPDEWMNIMRGLGITFDEDEFLREYDSYDTDRNGSLDFNELLSQLAKKQTMGTAYQAAGIVDEVSSFFITFSWFLILISKIPVASDLDLNIDFDLDRQTNDLPTSVINNPKPIELDLSYAG